MLRVLTTRDRVTFASIGDLLAHLVEGTIKRLPEPRNEEARGEKPVSKALPEANGAIQC